ncbi:MAG TPA: hypothetical protein H9851_00485 [Candidatus Borkfalkia faecavium]|uniref:Uncharacterized protein n=1 Tax=Candidatus Borkfalkia faecavium TaxID=2838508 RepID=A0A9D2ATI7_9FIRM|nr:hypothetical protein [Candidatus Borkfalkia faecavium]
MHLLPFCQASEEKKSKNFSEKERRYKLLKKRGVKYIPHQYKNKRKNKRWQFAAFAGYLPADMV